MIKSYMFIPFIALMLFMTSCNSQSAKAAKKVAGTNTEVKAVTDFFENIGVEKFNGLIAANKKSLIDVRTPGEFADGHITGASNLNVLNASFASNIQKMDKSKTYLVYCRSGNRSGKAMQQMKNAGFTKIYNLAGGVKAWKSAGLKLE